jgi:2,3-bisphosphoglycerate-independent phosphoglycerate mutase
MRGKNKLLFILLDGASDGLNYPKTSLDEARTTNLSKIAKISKGGLVYTIAKGISPESDAAALSFLGYNPLEVQITRGVLEALGAGLKFNEGDLALRCNFATAIGDEILDRRVGRSLSDEEAKELVNEIVSNVNLNYDYELVHTIGHRCVLVIRKKDKNLGSNISNLDPAYVRKGTIVHASAIIDRKIKLCEAFDEESKISAEIVNKFFIEARKVLENSKINLERKKKGLLPANILLLRDAGSSIPKVKKFEEKYKLKAAAIAEMPVEVGVAKILGIDVYKIEYIKSLEIYKIKANLTLNLLNKYDFVYVHIKGPDEPAHDGNFELKVKAIEEIDEYFFGELLNKLELDKISIFISCDHSTPVFLKSHSDDPVPFIYYKPEIKPDGILKFSEKECVKGSFGILEHAYEILKKFLS